MPEPLTEERLAEIEATVRWGIENRPYFPGSMSFGQAWMLELIAEVRRLRKILDGEHHKPGAFDRMTDWAQQMENERDDARSLLKQAVSYLYCHMDERVRAWTLEMNQLFVKWADEELTQRKLR